MKFIALFLAFCLSFAFGAGQGKLELLRLSEFKDQNVSGWLASEKLDGVRVPTGTERICSQGRAKN